MKEVQILFFFFFLPRWIRVLGLNSVCGLCVVITHPLAPRLKGKGTN